MSPSDFRIKVSLASDNRGTSSFFYSQKSLPKMSIIPSQLLRRVSHHGMKVLAMLDSIVSAMDSIHTGVCRLSHSSCVGFVCWFKVVQLP